MSLEAAVLGLLCAVRAVPLAAIYTLMTAREPRWLLAAYLAAGLILSLTVGIAVVGWFESTARSVTSTTAGNIIYLVIGVGALSYAAGFWIGRIGNGPKQQPPESSLPKPESFLRRRLRAPSVADAAVAGAITNLPGLFYIAGLVAILETRPGPVNGVLQVVIFNLLRFAVPIAALALVIFRPGATRTVVDAIYTLARRHSRPLIIGVFGTVGIYLSAKGLIGLVA